jgi:multidrug efflux pump subunit AcrB
MWLVKAALRRPITVLVAILGLLLAAVLSIRRMPRDLFPELGRPVLYLVETWPGMTPSQMEGLIAARFEYHFLYLAGIEHIETRAIANTLLTKLFFQPDTDTSYAVAQTVAMAYRATATMPKGTPPPFIMRLDGGSYPIANLVFESSTRTDSELLDVVFSRIRPLLATMEGVSAPPPIGGAPRMVMVSLDPKRLQRYGMSPDEVVAAIGGTNLTLPKGSVWLDDRQALIEANFSTSRPEDLDNVPLRMGKGATVYLRDVGKADIAGDVLTNTVLVNGARAVHMPITKRAGASTLGVIEAVRAKFPEFRAALPADVSVRLVFDQSSYVLNAIHGLLSEAVLGALLTGVAVLLFLHDWRSAIVVIVSIPTSILAALIVLSLAGETINVMTLGGLVLAVGILVDEATVAIENVNLHLSMGKPKGIAVRDAMGEVQIPRLVAMLCICAVFLPAFYMVGTPRALFASLALAVGLAMASSFLVSSTLVPVLSVWMLRSPASTGAGPLAAVRRAHARIGGWLLGNPYPSVLAYLVAAAGLLFFGAPRLPQELFPRPDSDYLQMRVRAPQGTDLDGTEAIVRRVVDEVSTEMGPGGVTLSLADIGSPPPLYPSDAVYVFNTGPDAAVVLMALAKGRGRSISQVEEILRGRLSKRLPLVGISFERADVLSQVLSVGTGSPVDIVVIGQKLKETRQYAERIRDELAAIPDLRDLAIPAPLDTPALKIDIDRERAAQLGVMPSQVGRALAATDWSSQMVNPLFWVDSKGSSYFVAVRAAEDAMTSVEDVRGLPVMGSSGSSAFQPERPLLRDVATVALTKTQGEYAHWDSRRCLHISANSATKDLAGLAKAVRAAIARAGAPPSPDIRVMVRGEIQQMEETIGALQQGFILAVVVVLLLLAATFQSVRSAVAIIVVVPAVLAGVVVFLLFTRTSLNVQSAIGAIMAVGVAMANSVLLVQLFHDRRRAGVPVPVAAAEAAAGRLRAILMTSLCMLAGMTPMALGLGEAGEQNASLGRAVVGGLLASTLATLFVLPAVLCVLHRGSRHRSVSLDPGDPTSEHYVPSVAAEAAARGGV